MPTHVTLPELGLQPGDAPILSVWLVDKGDFVFEGDRLVEVLLTGATVDLTAPISGRLVATYARPDDILQVGQVLAEIEPDDARTAAEPT